MKYLGQMRVAALIWPFLLPHVFWHIKLFISHNLILPIDLGIEPLLDI